jgi:hypothetical protein
MKPTPKQRKIEKQIFNMVYQWGRYGINAKDNSPAFVDLMADYRNGGTKNIKLK